jgi:hypothetical protein
VAITEDVETGHGVPRVVSPTILQRRVDGNRTVDITWFRRGRSKQQVDQGIVLLRRGREDGARALEAGWVQEEGSALWGDINRMARPGCYVHGG